eukprot:12173853-Alexandrium_andersonii.AAC.1
MGDAMCLDCERPSGAPIGSRPALGRSTDARPSGRPAAALWPPPRLHSSGPGRLGRFSRRACRP